MTELQYLALLGNVNKTILRLNLGDGFHIEEWKTEVFIPFYEQMFGNAEHDIWIKFDSEWGYAENRRTRPKHVYVVTKRFSSYPTHSSSSQDMDEWMRSWRRRSAFEREQESLLEDKLLKLRLIADGSIKVCAEFFYIAEADGPMMESGREEGLHGENRLYKMLKGDLHAAQALLNSPPLNVRHKYIRFALENYQQSFRVAQYELEFISLMLAFEAIFNDGKQELRNKVARGCAVLLGRTLATSRLIFKEVRDLYDKRSVLVHTGDKSKISHTDVTQLKTYVRKSLATVVELDVSKDELSLVLTEAGFGALRLIGKRVLTLRSTRTRKMPRVG